MGVVVLLLRMLSVYVFKGMHPVNKAMLVIPLLAGIMWGSCGIFVRFLSDAGFDNATILFMRVSLSALFLFFGLLIYDRQLLLIKLRDIWIFLGSGVLGTMGLNLCYNEAIVRLSLSLAAVLLSLSPILVLLLAALLFKERFTVRKIACACFAIMGCVLVSGVFENGVGIKWSATGVCAGLLSAFFYALYSIFSKVAMERGYGALTITFYGALFASIVLIPLVDVASILEYTACAPAMNSVLLLAHALCTYVLPYVLYTVSLKYVEAGKAAILAAGGEPAAAMLFGILFFKEPITGLMVAGLAVIIIALSVFSLSDKQTKEIQNG